MDMELSEQQQHLIDTARRFMENECPLSAVREQEDFVGYEARVDFAEHGLRVRRVSLSRDDDLFGFGE